MYLKKKKKPIYVGTYFILDVGIAFQIVGLQIAGLVHENPHFLDIDNYLLHLMISNF